MLNIDISQYRHIDMIYYDCHSHYSIITCIIQASYNRATSNNLFFLDPRSPTNGENSIPQSYGCLFNWPWNRKGRSLIGNDNAVVIGWITCLFYFEPRGYDAALYNKMYNIDVIHTTFINLYQRPKQLLYFMHVHDLEAVIIFHVVGAI